MEEPIQHEVKLEIRARLDVDANDPHLSEILTTISDAAEAAVAEAAAGHGVGALITGVTISRI